ncbi:MAG TPA: metallophosphoesterase family protein [Methylomirabilota bacterium]|nr:metallophosphoesterase family protein [Methylomirabilota bacterium]
MRIISFFILLCAAGAASGQQSTGVDTNDVRAWLRGPFRSWLTRSYPEITTKVYPDWFHEHPIGLNPALFTNWLSDVFPDLETETYPTWLENRSDEALGTNMPAWWATVQKGRFAVSPAAQPIPAIVRGPYLQLGTTNSIVVRWRTDIAAGSTISYGTNLNRLNRSARSSGTLIEHAVLITNLSAGNKYYYEFGPNDTPLLVHLTNDIAFVRSTNSRIYVNKPRTREQIAMANRDTFTFSLKRDNFVVSDPEKSFTAETTNSVLVVNTPNNAVLLTASNNAIVITTSNHVRWLDNTRSAKGRDAASNFIVGTTNVIYTGGDSNTFFVTHPPIGKSKPTRVWVLGDPGTRKKGQFDVRDAYYKWTGDRQTDFWLVLGDVAYTSGRDSEYQRAIFQVYDTMLRKSVMWPALGNHDAGSANSPIEHGIYYDTFMLPSQGQAGGVMSGTEAYYSFDYANIHVVCIDSADSSWGQSGAMLKWLQADLEANKQDWLIAYCHHPPYTKGSHDSDNDRDSEARMRMMRERVLPVLESYGLDLMLTGHSHAYERSFLTDGFYGHSTTLNEEVHFKSMKDGRSDGTGIYVKPSKGPAPREGAVYVVAGSSGQISGGRLQHPVKAISLNVLGSLVLDIDGHRLDATFIDDKAVVRDYFTIIKGGEPADPEVSR